MDKMRNSLPSGSAIVIQPLPSGRRWSASSDAPSARVLSVSCSRVRSAGRKSEVCSVLRLRRFSHGPAMCTRRLHCPRSLPISRMLAHAAADELTAAVRAASTRQQFRRAEQSDQDEFCCAACAVRPSAGTEDGPPADGSTRSAGAVTLSYPSTAFQNGRTAGMSIASIAIASDELNHEQGARPSGKRPCEPPSARAG